MATVKITPQLDTKPAIKSFNKLKKDMTNPSNQAQMSKLVRSFDFRKQLSDVGKMHTQFSKMAASSEKSQKRQEISAKIERIRKYKAIRDELSFQNKKETSIKRQSNLSKAYQRMDLIGSAGGGMAMAAGLQSHIGQYQGGGFSSLIQSQMSTVAGAKNYMSEKYQQWKADREEKKAQQEQQRPSNGQTPQKSKTGNLFSSMGSAIPMAGVIGTELIAKGVGAMAQLGSDMAEAHQAAMNSQAGTTGATLGYVGTYGRGKDSWSYTDENGQSIQEKDTFKKGAKFTGSSKIGEHRAQGFFHDSEIAQGQVSYNRAMDQMGDKKISGQGSLMPFAAQQGMGFGSAATAMGEIHRTSKDIRVEFIKGAAKASGIQGLKQGEFLTKFAEIVKQNRESGFGNMDAKSFLSLSTGLSKQGGMMPERGMSVMQSMDKQVRQGEKGGFMGAMALVAELQKTDNVFEAIRNTEKGITQEHINYASKTAGSADIMGMILRQEGSANLTEGSKLYNMKGATIKDEEIGAAGQNASIKASNIKMGFDAKNDVGAKVAERLLQASLNLTETIAKMGSPGKDPDIKIFMEKLATIEEKSIQALMDLTGFLRGSSTSR